MLKKLFFSSSLNSALRELGIDATSLDAQLRNAVVDQATKMGLSPKEAAIGVYMMIAKRMNAIDRMAAQEVVREWRTHPEVRESHYQLAIRKELWSPRETHEQ